MDRPLLSSLNLDLDSKSGVKIGIQANFGEGLLVSFNLTVEDICKEVRYRRS